MDQKQNFLQRIKSKFSSKTQYQAPARPVIEPAVDKDKFLYSIGMNETSVIPEGEKYSFTRYSGKPKLGLALGKYNVTEGELKIYAKRYLGADISSKEFLENPGLQDRYTYNKARYLSKLGYTPQQIADIHNQGMTNVSDPGSSVYQSPDYVNKFNINYNR